VEVRADGASASALPSSVERVEVERAIVPEEVAVPWETEPVGGIEPEDPWEQGPEPYGIALAADEDTDPGAGDEARGSEPQAPPHAVEPRRRPQAVRPRRGRR
jgi:hypothetical protein